MAIEVPAERAGISVRDVLRLPALRKARLVAGEGGLDRLIRSVNMMEVPDIGPFLKSGELLVTTAFPIRDDVDAQSALVPLLDASGLAALAIKPGRYLALPERMLEQADHLGFPILALPDDASFNEILLEVLGRILNEQAVQLRRSREIHDRLTAVVLAGGSFHELIRTLSELVGQPTALLDSHGDVLAAAPAAGRLRPDDQRHARPVRVGALHHGEVIVWSAGDLPSDAAVAMDHAATIAALLIAQARAVLSREQRYRIALLHELVSGRPVDTEELTARATAFGWNLKVRRTAVMIDLHRDGQPLSVAGQPIEEQVLAIVRAVAGTGAIAWGLPSGIELLVQDGGVTPRLAREFADRDIVASAGFGSQRETVELHVSHREAFEALELGRQLHSSGFVVSHSELGVFRLLHQLRQVELERHVKDVLGPLLDHDLEHGTALVDTLDALLRNRGNKARAARELFVHYNTLRYRLEQIERLTGGVDRHPTSRSNLELALHARTLLSARARSRNW